MKFSEAWLREWVDPAITTEQLVAQLTMAGLEVDGVEPAAGQFSGVIVGEILSAEPHPNAEKLRVCQVKGHADSVQQVVCGAANARPGIKVPFATVGAHLPELTIKKATLRGVESAGMLCAQTELQAGDDDSGLWELPEDAPVGADLRTYLRLDDSLIEVDLTPNRGDCLSIRGLAREVAALNQAELKEVDIAPVPAAIDETFRVTVQAPDACPHYVGRVIRNIDINKPTPVWIREKLRRSGIRSIDSVVDITNYVMLELGQPMHAFDLDRLNGGIQVRMAQPGETLELLNEQKLSLTAGSLVIADEKRALALAGVMGGSHSGVSTSTRSVFLESAFFSPSAIAGKARSYGLHTDSSHRYERGVDWDLQVAAVERATRLLLDLVGGEPGPLVQVRAEHRPTPASVRLRRQRLSSGLGLSADRVDAADLLQRLGLGLLSEDADAWTFSIPSHRFDIRIEEDLLEEVGRIYGYNRLPTRPMLLATELDSQPETRTPLSLVKNHLVSRGYQEAITYSFIDPQLHALLYPDVKAVVLKNPISADMASMRTSLVPGLLQTLRNNLNRQQTQARLFESGMVFNGGDLNPADCQQKTRVAGLVYGNVRQPGWAEKSRELDFFDLKGDLESLLAVAARGRKVEFAAWRDSEWLHPGQAAQVLLDGEVAGYLGALHPAKQRALELPKPVFVFELDQAQLMRALLPRFAPLSRYPEVSRDLAVVVDKQHCVADLERGIRKSAGDVLKNLKLFDVYSGEGIDPKRKSLAFSLTFQHASRTLKDEEVNASIASVVRCLEEEFGANLR